MSDESDLRARVAHTIENQLRVLPAFVAAQGWTLAGTYIDDGRSAKTGKLDKREGFARLLVDAERKLFDVLAVVDIDRLTRTDDMIERASILGPFQRAGIQIVTPSGGQFDLRSMLGELYVGLQAQFAAEENRKRAERIKAGKARAIAEGRKPAGPTPFGLVYTRETGTWSLHVEHAELVREMVARVIAGDSCKTIADDLYERSAPSPRGPWQRYKVWQIVRSRTIVGEWSADKAARAVIRVPPIIDEETWQAAQDRLGEHGKRGLLKTKHVYLLEGLGVCGMCGSPIAIRSATLQRNRGHLVPAAYVCRARKYEQRGGRCTAPILPVAEIDARAWAIVERALTSDTLVEMVRRRMASRAANRRDWQADVRRYEIKVEQVERATAAIAARFRRGLLSETAFDLELAAAARERRVIAAQLDAARDGAKGQGEPQESAETWVETLRVLAASVTPGARQRVVRVLVPKGAALFVERDVELTLEIDEPGTSAPAISLVRSPGYRTQHGAILRLRLVA